MSGDASLNRRPMRRVIRPLTEMGAAIGSQDGRPPLTIDGARLRGITHRPEVPSAQIKSAVLLAGLQAEGETTVLEPVPTRDHTERAFHEFGVRVEKAGEAHPRHRRPTAQARASWWSRATCRVRRSGLRWPRARREAEIEIEGVGLNPTRIAMLEIVRRAGARIEIQIDNEDAGEPIGRIRVMLRLAGQLRY